MTILYIEDNQDDRDLVRTIGQELGIVVTSVDSVDIHRYDTIPNFVTLVLLDINMPCKDGLTVLRDIKEAQPDLPVVILSGSDEYFDRALEIGAAKCIHKGSHFGELITYLKTITHIN